MLNELLFVNYIKQLGLTSKLSLAIDIEAIFSKLGIIGNDSFLGVNCLSDFLGDVLIFVSIYEFLLIMTFGSMSGDA